MNRFHSIISCSILLVFVSFSMTSQERILQTLQTDWKFFKGHQETPTSIDFDDSSWKTIKLPHDWAIEGPFILEADGDTGKLPWKAEGWYRKALDIPNSYKNQRVLLIFDGVMAFP